ncbi:peptidoglycan-binding protein [Streptomyces sp. ME02-6987-2C]|uniref:peptidoglycan-binding protein n=1 Tax=unclassified Streptomyces TaxID=2593676 RepID=UPI0029BF8BD6|nr:MULTISPECIES: peptidoglycan-binding protein [unclassified Streptomyces]MDX3366261.1 peptidoglycan-binding protein [Streptomyces sp. ME02-6987-2C]MDX3425625.1 peptidoglycan-binding protein [Streptomyces sp. ME02-6985-2c]
MRGERDPADTVMLRAIADGPEREREPGSRRSSRSRRRGVISATAVLLTFGVGAGLLWARGDAGAPAVGGGPDIRTVTVTRTDLSGTREIGGTLGYTSPRTLRGPGQGRVTWLAKPGTAVERGRPLYRVDERPTVVFYGSTPMYRRLDAVGLTGRDVRVVADNLTALGYDIGSQPSPGMRIQPSRPAAPGTSAAHRPEGGREEASASQPPPAEESDAPPAEPSPSDASAGGPEAAPPPVTVKEGDSVLTSSLTAAIRRWQPTVGMQPTGVLDVSDVVVTQAAVRIGEILVQPGDEATAELMTVTSTTKSVTVPVEAVDIGSIKRKQRVTVVLPDRSEARGRVTGFSSVVRGGQDGTDRPGPSRIDVTVSLDDPEAVKNLDAAPVEARFEAESRRDVLAVPVGALLALREGGYSLRLTGGGLVPVKTGMFAEGLVEVSGEGVTEGMKVEATS